MAEMATTPVFACRNCGKPVYVVHLSSVNDPDASKLKVLMQGLVNIALCPECRKIKRWRDAHGREFRVNPQGIIYSVIDKSDADYYGRNMK